MTTGLQAKITGLCEDYKPGKYLLGKCTKGYCSMFSVYKKSISTSKS